MTWTKYKIQKKQEYVSGGTWVDIVPLETRYGEVLGIYNTFSGCSGYDLLTRWITEDINKEYICSGYTKYYKEVEQVSYDRGETWYSFIPEISRVGGVYEEISVDCLPSAGHYRVKVVLPDDSEYILPCTAITSSSTLTIQDWNVLSSLSGISSGDIHTAKEMYIGDCITKIGVDSESGAGYSSDWPIYDFDNLEFISMADSVTDIGKHSMPHNDKLKAIKLSSNLKNIWPYAINDCNMLSSLNLNEGLENIYEDGLVSYRTEKIKIPDSVKYIGTRAVNRFVTEIEIGTGLTTIASNAFENYYRSFSPVAGYDERHIYNRKLIFNSTTPPTISGNSHSVGSEFNSMFVPSQSVSAYSNTFNNGSYISRCVIYSKDEYVENADDMILTTLSATSLPYQTIPYVHWRSPEIKSGTVTLKNLGMGISVNQSKPIKIWLSDKVTNIDNDAFGFRYGGFEDLMQSLTIEAIIPPIANKAYTAATTNEILFTINKTYPIYVPAESVDAYKNSEAFARVVDRIRAIPSDGHMNDVAFIGYYENGEVAEKLYRIDLSGTTILSDEIINVYSIITAIVGDFVTEVGDGTFSGCTLMKNITIKASTPPTIGTNVFPDNCIIYVPANSVDTYKSEWSNYASIIQAIPAS